MLNATLKAFGVRLELLVVLALRGADVAAQLLGNQREVEVPESDIGFVAIASLINRSAVAVHLAALEHHHAERVLRRRNLRNPAQAPCGRAPCAFAGVAAIEPELLQLVMHRPDTSDEDVEVVLGSFPAPRGGISTATGRPARARRARGRHPASAPASS